MSQLVREFIGTICCCGKPKPAKHPFCLECYYSLPEAMRRALYRRMGEGYEEAYFSARDRLGFGVRQ